MPVEMSDGRTEDVRFQMQPFEGMEEVRLGFRVAGEGADEHWMNRYAACLTSTSWGANSDTHLRMKTGNPYGRMCHAELMMQMQPGIWTRHSIYMGTYDPETKTIEPGKAHAKIVDDSSISDKFDMDDERYEIVSFKVNREDQLNAVKFLANQIDTPFNKKAYYWNLVPGFSFGTRQYDYSLNTEKMSWYCTELIVCALQAMVANPSTRKTLWWGDDIWSLKANHSSPNLLYRTMKQSKEVRNTLFRYSDRTALHI